MNGTENSTIYSSFPWTNIRIVLVETSHPGNIGGVARAMKNMQLESLYLVQPKQFPDGHALARASGATDLLENAVVCNNLAEAIADCRLVIAASARRRTIPWPQIEAPEAAAMLIKQSQQSPVAMVFGREDSGLNNEELDHCHYMVQLPTNPDFSSLNLAAAVQVFSYEIRKSYLEAAAGEKANEQENTCMARPEQSPASLQQDTTNIPASSSSLQRLFSHLERALLEVNFMPEHRTRTLMRKLIRFFYKSQITEEEVNIFRGILSELERQSSINKDLKKESNTAGPGTRYKQG